MWRTKQNSKYTSLLFQRHKMKRRKAALVAMIAEEESNTAEQRCKNCNINRTDKLGHKETFMIFLCFCLQKESFLHITYILCISVAENNEIDGENPFWVIIDVGGDRFQARRWSSFKVSTFRGIPKSKIGWCCCLGPKLLGWCSMFEREIIYLLQSALTTQTTIWFR